MRPCTALIINMPGAGQINLLISRTFIKRAGIVQFYAFRFFPQPHIQEFDHQRERDHRVDIAFTDFLVKSFGNKHDTYSNKERKCQHLERRILIDESADCATESDHNTDRNYYGNNHYKYLIHQADGG